MVNTDIILSKAAAVNRHLDRITVKSAIDLKTFLGDIDVQESILFNLQMAVQNCIDIAAHIISDENLGAPQSNNEMFYILEENGYIDSGLAEKMVKAIGFRNLIVHQYARVDLKKVFQVAGKDIYDLNEFIKALFIKLKLK